VTGIRYDAYAKNNRLQVVKQKSPELKGKFLNPEAFGLSKESGVSFDPGKDLPSAHAINSAERVDKR